MTQRMYRDEGINRAQAMLAGLVIAGLALAGIAPALAEEEKQGDVESRALGQMERPMMPLGKQTQPGTPSQLNAQLPTEVWLADLAISLTANKDVINQVIVYQMMVTNLGDDDGREIALSLAFSHSLPPGLKVLNVNSRDTCGVYEPTPGLPVVKCGPSTLSVGVTSTVTVAVANPGNGSRKATAQVMGIVPDYNGANNTVTITTP